MMYLKGEGVPRSQGKAVKCLAKAADAGSEDAMLMLGKLSLSGEGMVKSERNAEKWLKKAASRGSLEAAEILDRIKEERK